MASKRRSGEATASLKRKGKEGKSEGSDPNHPPAAAESTRKRNRTPLPRRKKPKVTLEENKGASPEKAPMEEDVPEHLSDDPDCCPVNLIGLKVEIPRNLGEWSLQIKEVFKLRSTFADLGRHLWTTMGTLPTPLGNFVRSFCSAAQPPTPSGSRAGGDHGDLLPIAPWSISTDIVGVTEVNLPWIRAIVSTINFQYCTGWATPVCVPMRDELTGLQKQAIARLAGIVESNICTAHPVATLGESEALLSSKKYDYAGRPVEYMQDLVCDKVIMAWPKVGQAAIQPITKFLNDDTKELFKDPNKLLLPKDKMPANALKSRVRATDKEWFRIVQEGVKRGMMKPVSDDLIPRDRNGHFITNGAGAVYKEKMVDGKKVEAQRFISILCPINAVTEPIPGSQDTLPYIGQLTGLMLEESESLYLDSEDLQSAFNLFSIPDQWLGYFSYSKKTDSSAFGMAPGTMLRPALSVVPMGWHSAVALVQEAVRFIVFTKAGVPRSISAEKGRPLPAGKHMAVIYLDNFDEIQIIKSLDVDLQKEGKELSPFHAKFNSVCDELGLPRNEGKQLIHAFAGGMQGGEFDCHRGVLKLGSDKLRSYVNLSMALLARRTWNEYQLRHWTGKTAFMATFKRSLFSGMAKIFDLIELSKKGEVYPNVTVVDEVFVLMIQACLSQVNLKATISPEISCTDASPTGGGSGVATQFKANQTPTDQRVEFDEKCLNCGKAVDILAPDHYICPSDCGGALCSVRCVAEHKAKCTRSSRLRPTFGERFSGPNFPLSKAVAQAGLFVQPPLDRLIEGDEWDFFTPEGKERLEEMEDEGELTCSHWAPECKTFSAARGRPIYTTSGHWISGPPALRNSSHPWGFPKLSKTNGFKVRQGNAMAKRSIAGVKDAHKDDRFGSMEHPWGSWIWYTPEAEELQNLPGIFVSSFSACCFGGQRVKWTTFVHNIPMLHEVIHKETCPGHQGLLPYEVHDQGGELSFDTALEAEYAWKLCKAYASSLVGQLKRQKPSPVGDMPFDKYSAILSALRSSTRGFQKQEVAERAAAQVFQLMRRMTEGMERDHLCDLLRQVCLRGTDIKLLCAAEDGSQSVMTPYPALCWDWKTKLSYQWRQPQHINVLEVTAFLVEFRRRTRSTSALGSRFFNITDSQVMFHCLTKGRSSSAQLNRLLRRVNAVILMSECQPLHLWTISKWNFADRPSRRFQYIAAR